jgi:hypothetical protein
MNVVAVLSPEPIYYTPLKQYSGRRKRQNLPKKAEEVLQE